MIKPTHKLEFDYSKISELIYLGSDACCKTHFAKALLDKGIRADISLEQERLDEPHGVDFYLWLPVKDMEAPTQAQLSVGVQTMEEMLANQIKIYIHCQYGIGRSPTLLMAYFIAHGWSLQAAYDLVKTKRPVTKLTPKQFIALKKFAKQYK